MDLLQPDFGLIFWTAVVFLLTFLLLAKFAWKPILKLLNEREKGIADSIASAERIKAEMSQLKSEHEQVLMEAKAERSQILKEAKQVRDQLINEAREGARTEARKIIDAAQVVINNQKLAAMTELKNQVGLLVLEVSEKVLRRELADREDQQQYISRLTENIKLN
ncbi:MAG TPA: F0F1 ATP synthase subunit B [Chitinophagaceae bacterium]|nr:F0F1 ATP synthase subunit B [Chitinophagaceae bacterium]